jgi:hypothetical protein
MEAYQSAPGEVCLRFQIRLWNLQTPLLRLHLHRNTKEKRSYEQRRKSPQDQLHRISFD